jgi:uncharacterized protein YbbK (DUF523 family)
MGALEGHNIFAICPEVLAGFGVPRLKIQYENEDPNTIHEDPVVRNELGQDVTGALLSAVGQVVEACRRFRIRAAFLKENSPSCGTQRIPWCGRRIEIQGPLARRLETAGIRTFSEENFAQGLKWLKSEFYNPSGSTGSDTGTGTGKS